MESAKINHLKQIGDCVKRERNKRKMNQLEFYRFLYPGSNLANEGIKSYMNEIENAKRKKIDPDFLLELHEKCDLGMDYIFGYETEFPNHESENASNYTGLSVETIELLHKLALAKKAEIPSLEPGMNDEDYKNRCNMLNDKQEADWILKIVEVLLTEDMETNEGSLPNFNILFDLYMIAVMRPATLRGIELNSVEENDGLMQISGKYKDLYVDSLYMKDTFGISHTINMDKVHQQIWKDKLYDDVKRFISTAQNYFSKSSDGEIESSRNRLFDN